MFSATLVRNGAGGTLSWRLTFQGLTGKAVGIPHSRRRARPAGAVQVSLCGPCRSGARGTARVNAKTVTALLAGRSYVNVHTAKNPAGEIRGQVVKAPKRDRAAADGHGHRRAAASTAVLGPTYTVALLR